MKSSHAILLIPFLLCCHFIHAQVDSNSTKFFHKIKLSISGGIAFPVGKFSTFEIEDSTKYTENIAGIAGQGYNAKLQAVYQFSKSFGVNMMVYTSVNKGKAVDEDDLFYDPQPYSHGLGGGSVRTSYTYATEDWHTSSILAGIVIIASKDNPIISFRINGGVQKVQSPESQLSVSGYIWQLSWPGEHPYQTHEIQPSMTSTHFVINLGSDIEFLVAKNWNVIGSIDYIISRASFSGQSSYTGFYTTDSGQYYYENSGTTSFEKNISLINVNLGISYAFK